MERHKDTNKNYITIDWYFFRVNNNCNLNSLHNNELLIPYKHTNIHIQDSSYKEVPLTLNNTNFVFKNSNQENVVNIITVKIDENIDFYKYIKVLDAIHVNKILSFQYYKNQVVEFYSCYLKSFYLAKKYLNTSLPVNNLIIFNSCGKPMLKPPYNNIYFNISHNSKYVTLAISQKLRVGIDIEEKQKNTLNIVSKVLSNAEKLAINSAKNTPFLLLWTKKEAYLKALGVGFKNNSYKNTNLTLQFCENTPKYLIYSKFIEAKHCVSICLLK